MFSPDRKMNHEDINAEFCSVSVVIPCLNEEAFIEQLLDAVRAQDYPLHEVIVVDCGSADGTVKTLELYRRNYPFFPLQLILHPGGSIPAVMNVGVRHATGQAIVRLDAHSCPSPSYVRLSVRALRQSGAGVVGGIWRIVPGAPSTTAQAIASAVSHGLGAGDAAYRIGPSTPGRTGVDTVPFGCYLKSTWEKLGGYNESLLTNEDYEFNYRCRLAQLQVILDSNIECLYVARSNWTGLAAQYFRYGWWKADMLKQHPLSLRWRQAVPAGFVATLLGLVWLTFFWRIAWIGLSSLLVLYVSVLVAAALGMRHGVPKQRVAALLPFAFMTVHLSWGAGAWVNMLTFGKWPKWGADG